MWTYTVPAFFWNIPHSSQNPQMKKSWQVWALFQGSVGNIFEYTCNRIFDSYTWRSEIYAIYTKTHPKGSVLHSLQASRTTRATSRMFLHQTRLEPQKSMIQLLIKHGRTRAVSSKSYQTSSQSRNITSWHAMQYHIISWHLMACHIMPWHVVLFHEFYIIRSIGLLDHCDHQHPSTGDWYSTPKPWTVSAALLKPPGQARGSKQMLTGTKSPVCLEFVLFGRLLLVCRKKMIGKRFWTFWYFCRLQGVSHLPTFINNMQPQKLPGTRRSEV